MKAIGIPNNDLLEAGLDLMDRNGHRLSKIPKTGAAKLYRLQNGETVRVRTCNDHVLLVVKDPETNKLNIEGTDHLLVVMPEAERTPGDVIAYLIPAATAANAARTAFEEWLKTNPNTDGNNNSPNLWFSKGGPATSNNFAEKWSEYRLSGKARVGLVQESSTDRIRQEVETAREKISKAAGVPIESVRISIDFSV